MNYNSQMNAKCKSLVNFITVLLFTLEFKEFWYQNFKYLAFCNIRLIIDNKENALQLLKQVFNFKCCACERVLLDNSLNLIIKSRSLKIFAGMDSCANWYPCLQSIGEEHWCIAIQTDYLVASQAKSFM